MGGRDMDSTRRVSAGTTSAVELMAGSGLKYIHVSDGDVQRNKQQIIEMGYLHKENFEEGGFTNEKSKQRLKMDDKKAELEQKEKLLKSWKDQKDKKEKAKKLLPLIKCPVLGVHDVVEPVLVRTHRESGEQDEILKVVINVGMALKKIDSTLIDDWARWCMGMISFNSCLVLWDYFEPNLYY